MNMNKVSKIAYWLWNKAKAHGIKVLILISVYSLYYFLFEDYFRVDPAVYYSICATFLTLYIWKKNQVTK